MHIKTCFPNGLSSRIGFVSASVLEPSGMGVVFTKTKVIIHNSIKTMIGETSILIFIVLHVVNFSPFGDVGKVKKSQGLELCLPK